MEYNKTVYTNNTPPALNSANLNKSEQGLEDIFKFTDTANISSNGDENFNVGGNVRYLQQFFEIPTNYDRLTDKSNVTNSTFNNNGDIISGKYMVFPQYIKVEPSTTYIASGISYFGACRGYDASKNVVNNGVTVSGKTITTAVNVSYIRISVNNAATAKNVVLQLGNTASAYHLTLKNVDVPDNSVSDQKIIGSWHNNNMFVGLNGINRIISTEVYSEYTLIYWEGELLCRGKYGNNWTIASATSALGASYTGTDSQGRTCVKIPLNYSFVIDTVDTNNRLKVVSNTDYDYDTQVLLGTCVLSGITQGMLVPLILVTNEKAIKDLNSSVLSLQASVSTIGGNVGEIRNTAVANRESTPNWVLGNLYDNGNIGESTKRMVTDFLPAYDGEKIIIEPNYNNGISVKVVMYTKNSLGNYVFDDLIPAALYENGTRTELVIPKHCYIRVGSNYRYDPVLTEDSMAALANMIFIQHSKTLLDYGNKLESFGEYQYEPSVDFVTTNRDLQNENTISFVWASDTHHQIHNSTVYGLSAEKFKEMANVAEFVRADFLTVTGDIVNGYYPVAEQKFCLLEVINNIRNNCTIPALLIEGNHDDNSWYASASGSAGTEYTGLAEVLQNSQFTSYSMNNSIEEVEVDSNYSTSGYYYKDFKKSKIRVICLNTTDIPYIENEDLSLKYYGQSTFGFQERQIKWLAEKALKFNESGWGVIIMLHYDSNFAINTTEQKNIDNVNEVLEAFISNDSGTTTSEEEDFEVSVNYDFTNNPSNEVLAWFSGHRHQDSYEIINGIPHIMIINTFNTTGGGYDVVTLDRLAKKIYTKRYNGEALTSYNREINYGV